MITISELKILHMIIPMDLLDILTQIAPRHIQGFFPSVIQFYLSAIEELLTFPVFQDEMNKTHWGVFHQ